MFFVFIGPPGAGKGTQALRICERLGIAHLSTGDLLREACRDETPVGKHVAQYLAQGKLVPDDIVLQLVHDRIDRPDCVEGCLFDGFPRTLEQAEALTTMLVQRGTPLELALQIDVKEEVLMQRLSGRGREDDRPEVIHHRLEVYRQLTDPVLDYYRQMGLLRLVDGEGSEDQVSERINVALDQSNS